MSADTFEDVERALTGIQPWFWAILHARKNIENRQKAILPADGIGKRFFLHASLKVSTVDYAAARKLVQKIHGCDVPPIDALDRGVILGSARVVAVHPPGSTGGGAWHFPDQIGYELADVQILKPVRAKGALGFWKVTPDLRRFVIEAQRPW